MTVPDNDVNSASGDDGSGSGEEAGGDGADGQGIGAAGGEAGGNQHVGPGAEGGAIALPSLAPSFDELLEAFGVLQGRLDTSRALVLGPGRWAPPPHSWPVVEGYGFVRLFGALRPLALRKLALRFGVLEARDVAAMVEQLPQLQVRRGATAGQRRSGTGVRWRLARHDGQSRKERSLVHWVGTRGMGSAL